jgi:hypothetical protein
LPVLTDRDASGESTSGDQVPLQNNEPLPSVIPKVGSGTTDHSEEQQLTLPELPEQDSSEAQQLIEPQSDVNHLPSSDESVENASLAVWWEKDITAPVLRNRPVMAMSLPEALNRSLNEAPELKILHADWYISLQEELRRDAGFDWTTSQTQPGIETAWPLEVRSTVHFADFEHTQGSPRRGFEDWTAKVVRFPCLNNSA